MLETTCARWKRFFSLIRPKLDILALAQSSAFGCWSPWEHHPHSEAWWWERYVVGGVNYRSILEEKHPVSKRLESVMEDWLPVGRKAHCHTYTRVIQSQEPECVKVQISVSLSNFPKRCGRNSQDPDVQSWESHVTRLAAVIAAKRGLTMYRPGE